MSDDPSRLSADAVQAHTRQLRALARGLVWDRHAADDVVQDAWVTALRRPPPGGFSLTAWLAGIARNLVREGRRRSARERTAARPEAQPDAGGTAERLDTMRALIDAVQQLDEPYSTAVTMRFLDGLSHRAIARLLGVPLATVRTRVM